MNQIHIMALVKHNYSLLAHNSFGLDVKAREFVEYETEEELTAYLSARNDERPFLHIGGGNNLLFTKDFDGTILHSAIRGMTLVGQDAKSVLLRIGAAEVWDDIVERTISAGYYGLENLSLIPSEVGAAAVQNIGAYGAEAKDFIECVEVVDLLTLQSHSFSNADCEFAYRYSNFKGPWRGRYAVTHVVLRLSLDFKPNLTYGALSGVVSPQADARSLRKAVIELRQGKLPDPRQFGNAGSFFMNPVISQEDFARLHEQYPAVPHYDVADGVKVPAGWLIEQCGWKGRSLGNAAVYDKQALVLINRGGATPQEIMRLSDTVCADVKAKFGITITPEVNWI